MSTSWQLKVFAEECPRCVASDSEMCLVMRPQSIPEVLGRSYESSLFGRLRQEGRAPRNTRRKLPIPPRAQTPALRGGGDHDNLSAAREIAKLGYSTNRTEKYPRTERRPFRSIARAFFAGRIPLILLVVLRTLQKERRCSKSTQNFPETRITVFEPAGKKATNEKENRSRAFICIFIHIFFLIRALSVPS